MKSIGKNGHGRRYGLTAVNGLARAMNGTYTKSTKPQNIFIGPSTQGYRTKYIKAVSGTVEDRKPSFA